MTNEDQQFVETVHKWRDKPVTEQTPTLPCDVEIGAARFRKGVKLQLFLDAVARHNKIYKALLRGEKVEDALEEEAKDFCVAAGKFEQFGERNYKYLSEQFTLDEALEDLQKYQGYHFAHIEYKGWEIKAVKKDGQ